MRSLAAPPWTFVGVLAGDASSLYSNFWYPSWSWRAAPSSLGAACAGSIVRRFIDGYVSDSQGPWVISFAAVRRRSTDSCHSDSWVLYLPPLSWWPTINAAQLFSFASKAD